jgi:diguanylate cyclase (GGDEF)-like protein/PAS domain S-box-containing protein
MSDDDGAARLEALLRNIACTVSVLDEHGNVVLSAADGTPTLGYEDLVSRNSRDLVHPDDRAIFDEVQAEVLAEPGVEVDCQLRMRHAHGHYEVIEGTARNLLDDPEVRGIVVTTRNVSRRHRHDRLLADANAALEAIAAGQSLEEVAELVRDLLVRQGSDRERLPVEPEALFAALEGDETPGGIQARWILTLAMSNHRVATELRQRASVDSLTRLVNRVGFTEALREHLARGDGPAAVLLFDLDRFKQVNDAYGHSVGDAVLVSVADALRRTVRAGDVAARFGGDEFAVLCSELEGDDAEVAARRVGQRLAVALASTPGPVGTGLRAVASIGVSVNRAYGTEWHDPDSWIADADHAMYEAKRLGRGRVIVADRETRLRAGHRSRVETGLRDALDTGGLEVWFQPVVALPSRSVVGHEALLRWRSADGEVHTPGEFLQIAEDSGLMAAISLRTLGIAFEEAAQWDPLASGHLPGVSVNLSVTQLLADDLLDIVVGDLERSGLDPGRVVVELTEHVLGADEQLVLQRLGALRDLGIRLALDDFGTGWSSLRLVRTMPFDLIKIDRTFTADVDRSPESAEFAGRIVALARSMGRKVVAEGIEREAQLEVMADMGCQLGQGWLFGAPVPPERFVRREAPDPSAVLEG